MCFEDSCDAGCCGVPYYDCSVDETDGDVGTAGVEAETGCVAETEGGGECFGVVLGERVEEFRVHCSMKESTCSPFLR